MSDEKTADVTEEPVKKSKNWMFLAGGLVFLLLVAAAGLFASGLLSSDEGGDEAAEAEKVTEVVSLDPLVVNLADTEELHYVRVSISLGIYNPAPEVAFFDPSLTMPKLKDRLITVLAKKTAAELSGASAGEQLRKEILDKVNEISQGKPGKVLEIYFTEFIIQ